MVGIILSLEPIYGILSYLNFITANENCTFLEGFLPKEYSKADRVSMFARWKMFSDKIKQKSLSVLQIQKMPGSRNVTGL